MSDAEMVPYSDFFQPSGSSEQHAEVFFERIQKRRSVRSFSDRPVSRETMEWLVRSAGSAPSGANRQPWRFVCINDSTLKQEIRQGAEQEERDQLAGWLSEILSTEDEIQRAVSFSSWADACYDCFGEVSWRRAGVQ